MLAQSAVAGGLGRHEVAVQRRDVLVDRSEGRHEVAELVEVELLFGIGQGVVRRGVEIAACIRTFNCNR